jgi:cell division transport system permease protein
VSGGYGAAGAPATPAPRPTEAPRPPDDLIVYMHPHATPDQIDGARVQLGRLPGIRGIAFVDHQQAYDEFKELFRDSPEMIHSVNPEALPTSFRVDVGGDAGAIARIRVQAADLAGVREVVVPGR